MEGELTKLCSDLTQVIRKTQCIYKFLYQEPQSLNHTKCKYSKALAQTRCALNVSATLPPQLLIG